MSKQHTYQEIANDYNLWGEYVDPDATMTETDFESMSEEEKVALQEEMYGKDESTDDQKK